MGGRYSPNVRLDCSVVAMSKPMIITVTDETDDEYTPEQRRAIDAQLAEAENGRFYGPFNSSDEMIAHLKGALKKRATTDSKRPRS